MSNEELAAGQQFTVAGNGAKKCIRFEAALQVMRDGRWSDLVNLPGWSSDDLREKVKLVGVTARIVERTVIEEFREYTGSAIGKTAAPTAEAEAESTKAEAPRQRRKWTRRVKPSPADVQTTGTTVKRETRDGMLEVRK